VEKMGKREGVREEKYALFFHIPSPTPPLPQSSTGQATVTIQDGGIEPICLVAIASRTEITPALQANSRQSILEYYRVNVPASTIELKH